MTVIDFIPALTWSDLPASVRRQAQLCLLDLLGVAAGGLQTDLSAIIQEIIDRPGWYAGSSMVFLFEGNGTRTAVS